MYIYTHLLTPPLYTNPIPARATENALTHSDSAIEPLAARAEMTAGPVVDYDAGFFGAMPLRPAGSGPPALGVPSGENTAPLGLANRLE